MYLEITRVVKKKFGTWAKFSAFLGYKNNTSGLWFKSNIKRFNDKLAPLGLELTVKLSAKGIKDKMIEQGYVKE